MTDAKDIAAAPRCPRCGYDLSGTVATWTESCPLEGVCSECGLDVRWRNVLRPDLHRLPWLYEHGRSWIDPVRAIKTFLRSAWPWWLWRSVQPYHKVRPGRLSLYFTGSLLAAYLLFAVLTAVGALVLSLRTRPLFIPAPGQMKALDLSFVVETIGALLWPWDLTKHPDSLMWAFTLVCMLTAFPWLLALLPVTLRRCRVRRTHLLRVCAYTSAPLALWALCAGALRALEFNAWPPSSSTLYRWHIVLAALSRLVLLVCVAWTLLSWWCAVRFYLRLPHALAVTLVIALVDALLIAALFSAIAYELGIG